MRITQWDFRPGTMAFIIGNAVLLVVLMSGRVTGSTWFILLAAGTFVSIVQAGKSAGNDKTLEDFENRYDITLLDDDALKRFTGSKKQVDFIAADDDVLRGTVWKQGDTLSLFVDGREYDGNIS